MKNFLATVILFVVVMCTSLARAAVDIDLTKMSSTMVYSTVFNMVNNPAKFVEKTMRMRGE